MTDSVKVLLVDDHALLRKGMIAEYKGTHTF